MHCTFVTLAGKGPCRNQESTNNSQVEEDAEWTPIMDHASLLRLDRASFASGIIPFLQPKPRRI